ncbi:MAG: hypothetical protein HDR05_12530 [Lachnospiraceae bacterium]|nr:hypothetical protein [Lachnospiraceae bacterium]
MKNKTLTIILSVILIICIGVNIYQYTTASKLKNSLSVLTNSKNEITTDIENKATELNSITSEIEAANTTISELTARVDSLSSSINSTQSEIENVQEEISNIEYASANDYGLTEEEQAMLEEMEQEVMQKHPEWFSDTNPNKGTGNQGNWDNVGTPDNTANTPQIQFGQGDYSELGSDVTVY